MPSTVNGETAKYANYNLICLTAKMPSTVNGEIVKYANYNLICLTAKMPSTLDIDSITEGLIWSSTSTNATAS